MIEIKQRYLDNNTEEYIDSKDSIFFYEPDEYNIMEDIIGVAGFFKYEVITTKEEAPDYSVNFDILRIENGKQTLKISVSVNLDGDVLFEWDDDDMSEEEMRKIIREAYVKVLIEQGTRTIIII